MKAKSLLLSDILKDISILNDDAMMKITVDESLLNESKGLLDKTISSKKLMGILVKKPKTLLGQAIRNFLFSPEENRTIYPLEMPYDDIMNKLYSYQNNSIRLLSSKIYKQTVRSFCDNSEYFKQVPSHLQKWIETKDYTNLLVDSIKELLKNSTKFNKDGKCELFKDCDYFIPNNLASKLRTLNSLLKDRKFEIHHGHAGCGKSTAVMNACNNTEGKKLICSLSNTICNLFKNKVHKIDTFSCCKAEYFLLNDDIPANLRPIGYNIVVLDEFSQWGFEWIDLLIMLLENNPTATFYIMGDIDQIPTFLSSGSLLYSLIDSYKDHVKSYTEMHRFKNSVENRELVESVLKGDIKRALTNNNRIFTNLNEYLLKNTDCFITGTNNHVKYLNSKVLEARYNVKYSNDLYEIAVKCGDVPLIATETFKTKNGNKVFRNTRYKISTINSFNDTIVLNSLVDNKDILATRYELNFNFSLCYAITVNKAQGLEWKNVCCYLTSSDKNLKSFNALYVALTRGEDSIIITTEDEDKNYGHITIDDLQNILSIKYTFTNNIKEMDYED